MKDETREAYPETSSSTCTSAHALGLGVPLEVFYRTPAEVAEYAGLNGALDGSNPWCDADGVPLNGGWYYWQCFPGCLPDSEPMGPFPTESEARADGEEWQ